MNVLVACEFSGIVRDAFLKRGHQAWSCDLLPTESGRRHYQRDCLSVLEYHSWDLMIAHPPCTYLCSSGLHWNKRRPERDTLTEQALEFVLALMNLPIPRICIENPIGCISTRIRKPDQIIQPWQFGHGEVKATCFWLKGLPLLQSTNIVEGRVPKSHYTAPSPDRWKIRSRTYHGVADAMANQWGLILVLYFYIL